MAFATRRARRPGPVPGNQCGGTPAQPVTIVGCPRRPTELCCACPASRVSSSCPSSPGSPPRWSGVVLTLHVVSTPRPRLRARRASSSGLRRSAWRSARPGGGAWSTGSGCGARSRPRSWSSRRSGCRAAPLLRGCSSSPSFVAGLFLVPVFSVTRQSLSVLVPLAHQQAAFALDSVAVELTFMLSPGGRGAAGHAGVDVGRAHGRRCADGRWLACCSCGPNPPTRSRALHRRTVADELPRAAAAQPRRSSSCCSPGWRRRSCSSGRTCRSSRRSTTPAARPTSAG